MLEAPVETASLRCELAQLSFAEEDAMHVCRLVAVI
jgi:hypothetical protein